MLWQVIQMIRSLEHRKRRFQALIDQLVAACLDIDSQLLEGLPRIQLDHGVKMDRLRVLERKKVMLQTSMMLIS